MKPDNNNENNKDKNKLKIQHIPLHCPLCKKRFMSILGQPLANHTQIRCKTERGDIMDLGICSDCVQDGITLDTCNAILEGIKEHWQLEITYDKNIAAEEKTKKIKFHNSHTIVGVTRFIHTGKSAEKLARKKGKLL